MAALCSFGLCLPGLAKAPPNPAAPLPCWREGGILGAGAGEPRGWAAAERGFGVPGLPAAPARAAPALPGVTEPFEPPAKLARFQSEIPEEI